MGENLVRYAFCKDKETIELAGERLARGSRDWLYLYKIYNYYFINIIYLNFYKKIIILFIK